MIKIENYIDGELVSNSDNYIDLYNPSIGKKYGQCPNSSIKDLNSSITSSENAFNEWSQFSFKKRSSFLFKIADLLENELDDFAKAESLDNGKPLSLSTKLDIPRAIENLRFFADMVSNSQSAICKTDKIGDNYILKQPLGIVGTISPWNLPLYLFTWKIAPALVSGNCVIAKPSEITPLTTYMFSQLCIKAKLPKGVLNILHGYGNQIGNEIVKHSSVKAISFTGGTSTGKKIAVECSKKFKKLNLEMGGKNPVIIFDDCNYSEMIKSVLKSSFLNQGQICLSGSRIYVQNGIYNKFKEDLIDGIKKLNIGNPFDSKSDQGAIVSKEHLDKIKNYIEISKKEECNILIGGKVPYINGECSEGWYFEPTLIENFNDSSKVNQDEIFGPVVTLNSFDNEEDALSKANNSEYGLASVIWTENLDRANKIANSIESGIVWINCWLERDLRTPFGGIKKSGLGKEGGEYALDFFTENKNVCVKKYD